MDDFVNGWSKGLVYQPLQDPQCPDIIRLIELHPSREYSAKIVYNMYHISLDSPNILDYDALSYY